MPIHESDEPPIPSQADYAAKAGSARSVWDILLPRHSWPRQLLVKLELDRSVFYSVLLRVWQAVAGPISMLLISQFLTQETQGFYYTFTSLIGLQAFFELGLHGAIANLSSHEWAHLRLDDKKCIVGDLTAIGRLAAIKRFVARWYFGVAMLFATVVGTAGIMFFSRSTAPVDWLTPWISLIILSSLVLWTWAMTTVLEGCNQIQVVGRMRLIQGLFGSLGVWLSFGFGWGLWSAVVAVAIRLIGDAWLLRVTFREYFRSLSQASVSAQISWRHEILPLQWRLGLRGIVGYFAFGLFTPIMFEFHGATEAGKMGMTWTALSALEQASFAWVGTRTALFGMLAAKRDFRELNRVFDRVVLISWGILVSGSFVLCAVIAGLAQIEMRWAEKISGRLLTWQATALFCVGLAATHFLRSFFVYIYAHKQDPLLMTTLITSALIGSSVFWVGRSGGAVPMAAAFAGVLTLYSLPQSWWIWRRFRNERLIAKAHSNDDRQPSQI